MATKRSPNPKAKPAESPNLFGDSGNFGNPTPAAIPAPLSPPARALTPAHGAASPAPPQAAPQAPQPPNGPLVEVFIPKFGSGFTGSGWGQEVLVKPIRAIALADGGELLELQEWAFQPGPGRLGRAVEVLHALRKVLSMLEGHPEAQGAQFNLKVADADLNGFLIVHLETWRRMGLLRPGASLEDMALPFAETDRAFLAELAEIIQSNKIKISWDLESSLQAEKARAA